MGESIEKETPDTGHRSNKVGRGGFFPPKKTSLGVVKLGVILFCSPLSLIRQRVSNPSAC